jgi:hypothetical protein
MGWCGRGSSRAHMCASISPPRPRCAQSRTGRPPTAYVQYTFPTQSACFTASVPCTPNPVFDDRRTIALALTPSLTAHLRTTPLRFIVFDDDERLVRVVRAVLPTVLGKRLEDR